MSHDDFLDRLKSDWAAPPPDLDRLRLATLKRRRRGLLKLGGQFASGAIALAIGLWFAALAARDGVAALWLGAAGMFLAVPFTVALGIRGWRDARVDYGRTPRGVIEQARHQAQSELALTNGARGAAAILLLCAVGIWLLYGLALVALDGALLLSIVWAVTAAIAEIAATYRKRRLALEIAHFDRQLAELD